MEGGHGHLQLLRYEEELMEEEGGVLLFQSLERSVCACVCSVL